MSGPSKARPAAGKYRQYVLAGIFAAMGLYFGGEWLVTNVLTGPVEAARKKTRQLQRDVKKREGELAKARRRRDLLVAWESQSLPSDLEVARSLYQAWLVELVEDVQLESPTVNSGDPANRKGMYHALSFSVRGRGTLDQLTTFLFGFYRTDLLHQIRSINVTPVGKGGRLDLSISIEAMSVSGRSGGTQDEELVAEEFREQVWRESTRLASDTLADYEPIVDRNLFGVGGNPDPTDHTYLTAISLRDGEPEAWFTLRTTDQIFRLGRGEPLEVGQFSGTVAQIDGSDVVLESEGERWLLTVGENLTEAYALPPEF